MTNISLFSQIIQIIPRNKLSKLVKKHQSDKHNRGIDSWTHLVSMMFSQFAHAESVRDISNGLRSITGNINHLGLTISPSKSSISYNNKKRSSDLFKDFYFELLDHFKDIHYFKRAKFEKLKRKILLLDSTTIPLCLSLFDWAHFRQKKGAVKVHTLLDYDGCLPSYVLIEEGKKHDITMAKQMHIPDKSVLVMDKAYIDFKWLNNLDSRKISFVTRAKDTMNYIKLREHILEPKQDADYIIEDSDIKLNSYQTKNKYPKRIRFIRFWDNKNNRELTFMTNNFIWTASTIAELYKARWDIESFFKAIKQNLRIKSFVGTSRNAVQIQIWTALISMLLLSFLKAKAKYDWHLSNLVSFIRFNLFVKIDLWFWLNNPFFEKKQEKSVQLKLFSG